MTQQNPSLETNLGLQELVINRQRLAQEVRDLNEIIDAHTKQIKDLMLEAGVTDLEIDKFSITLNPYATRDSLDKTLLVEQGVTTEQIKAATRTTIYQRLDIREVKQK